MSAVPSDTANVASALPASVMLEKFESANDSPLAYPSPETATSSAANASGVPS